MSERDRALVAAMASVAEGLDRLVMLYGRGAERGLGLDNVGAELLREYGQGAAMVAAEMIARADELDSTPPALPPMVVDTGSDQSAL